MDIKILFHNLKSTYNNCDFSIIPLSNLKKRENEYIKSLMPQVKSAIVIMAYIKDLKDYIWSWPDGTVKSERCTIDDLCKEVCLYIKNELAAKQISTAIVPYPGESGLQFRFIALASGSGEIGRNAFYLHPEYGPRVHLRVMATELVSDIYTTIRLKTKKVCFHCGGCVNNCPANAFENGFNGLQCRKYRKARGEYQPVGKKRILKYCTKCLVVCKAGKK